MDKKDPYDAKTEKDETEEDENQALTSDLGDRQAGKDSTEAENDLTKTEENALNKMRRQRSEYSTNGDKAEEEAAHMGHSNHGNTVGGFAMLSPSDHWRYRANPTSSDHLVDAAPAVTRYSNDRSRQYLKELPASAANGDPLSPDAADPDNVDGDMATTTFIRQPWQPPLDTKPRPAAGASIEDTPTYRAPAELGDIELHDMERTGPPPEEEVEAYECTGLCWFNCVGTLIVRFYQQLCTAHSTYSRTKRILGIIALISIACLVLFIGVFSSSFEYVNYYNIALRKSRLTGIVDRNRVLYPGCYVLGPDVDLMYFSSTAHTISATVSVFTEDKMVIDVEVSLQYFLRPEEVGKLHSMFDMDYHDVFESLVFNTIKNEGTKHSLDMYRQNRPQLERDFHHKIRQRLGGTCCPSCCPNDCSNKTVCELCASAATCDGGYHADVEYFQMGKISIPNEVFDRDTCGRPSSRLVSAAEIRANATVNGKMIGVVAESEKEKIIQKSYIQALKDFYQKLNVVEEDHKLSLMMMRAYDDIKDNLYTSINASSLFLNMV
ncbi:uncharacterized protein LOC124253170 [Haliotis rubra]|uniref:uncharacterized protein LOC124253170 n=1 Tax=Haliotis rubra TaxID=36100 RepID=UPI001EE5BC75|nr:uncharacterized protein LOC124253170 [Haliotis rubra]